MCNQKRTNLQITFTPHRALPRLSDNNSTMIPVYRQKLKQEVPVTRSKRKWSDDTLQDWNLFRDSSNGTGEYTTINCRVRYHSHPEQLVLHLASLPHPLQSPFLQHVLREPGWVNDFVAVLKKRKLKFHHHGCPGNKRQTRLNSSKNFLAPTINSELLHGLCEGFYHERSKARVHLPTEVPE